MPGLVIGVGVETIADQSPQGIFEIFQEPFFLKETRFPACAISPPDNAPVQPVEDLSTRYVPTDKGQDGFTVVRPRDYIRFAAHVIDQNTAVCEADRPLHAEHLGRKGRGEFIEARLVQYP